VSDPNPKKQLAGKLSLANKEYLWEIIKIIFLLFHRVDT